ncbi:hypothetical protein [Candidatus Enterococcus murrayae]|uniref:Uncharacterized protein n=1 Tax=Candidatus Enterococcus murrayae TaxID=2815321 RepID=A0ABS3HF23_9ENTE|nr:hypothetical protein [Enterococcus sp. MJM16]MBO0452065.1 hypothetical protein [Enterococcus sp. MJM16]
MTGKELNYELDSSRATLNELLLRIETHTQARDKKIFEVNKYVSMVKDQKQVSLDHFVQLRKVVHHLTEEYTKINEIISYIKGFTACYDQVEPLMEDIASVTRMIERQEEQLKALSTSVTTARFVEESKKT